VALPAGRPLFDAIRRALLEPLDVGLDQALWRQLAPEALLSRLQAVGLDIDSELRQMLGGGEPNALHYMAAEMLRAGSAIWTTNLDELVEGAAERFGVRFHRLLPGNDPSCSCRLGHLVKVHGTLSAGRVLARSEDVLVPLPEAWLDRLARDLEGAEVAIVGYAGADIDLRTGLRASLALTQTSMWFGMDADRAPLSRRFAEPLGTGRLRLEIAGRPDLAALEWGESKGLTAAIPESVLEQARQPVTLPELTAQYRPNHLVRARVLDDLGDGATRRQSARREYSRALVNGPDRRLAAKALYSSGMIHGALWRWPVVRGLNGLCALPLRWHWPHRQRLPYLTWNAPADRRLLILERSLARIGPDPPIILGAANAAKEVNPRRAVHLGRIAQQEAMSRHDPADTAWATFILSLALRWNGDVSAAAEQAARLADGYDALAGPSWVAWGHFESGATKSLMGDLTDAPRQMELAIDVFTAAGSIFTFDAWCAMIAIRRAMGDETGERAAYQQAHQLLDGDPLRRRFKREVLMVEEAEYARQRGRLDEAHRLYRKLLDSPTLAQGLLGLLGLGEVQRSRGEEPSASWTALQRSDELGFGYGQVHAAITLGLAAALDAREAEQLIADSVYSPPVRPRQAGLMRFCQGADPADHVLCFP
jgi:tetratricopeptide (TPR) repeat protein